MKPRTIGRVGGVEVRWHDGAPKGPPGRIVIAGAGDEIELTPQEANILSEILARAAREPPGYYWAKWNPKMAAAHPNWNGQSFILERAIGGRLWMPGDDHEVDPAAVIIEGLVVR